MRANGTSGGAQLIDSASLLPNDMHTAVSDPEVTDPWRVQQFAESKGQPLSYDEVESLLSAGGMRPTPGLRNNASVERVSRGAGMLVRSIAIADFDAVHRLLTCNGWAHRVGNVEEFGRLILASQRALVAVADDQVVGFARAITDGISNGYLSMVVVAESHRRRGIGQALVERLVGSEPNITWVLRAGREGAAGFFAKLGFIASATAMERLRS